MLEHRLKSIGLPSKLQANELRYEAYQLEQDALKILTNEVFF